MAQPHPGGNPRRCATSVTDVSGIDSAYAVMADRIGYSQPVSETQRFPRDGLHLHKIEDGSVVVCVKSLPKS